MRHSINNQKGMTFIDILVTLSIILVTTGLIIYFVDPMESQAKARDEKRLADLTNMERAISEYVLDAGSYPDTVDTTRTSTTLPSGNLGPLESASAGWIDQDLRNYLTKLPLDPKNDATYYYSYRHTATGFELNCTLEFHTEYAQNDGGNNASQYELGNNLSIL